MADLKKEWGLPESPSEPSIHGQGEPTTTESTSAVCRGTELSLDQDDLVRQVMNELRQPSGGDQIQEGEDLVDIEIESGATTRPAIPSVQSAGEKFGQKLKKKIDEDRRRTLKVGGLTVKLPQPKRGEPARGTLAAKVQRVSSSMARCGGRWALQVGEAPTQNGGRKEGPSTASPSSTCER